MMFYVVPMYWSGVTQGLMWKQFTADGFLQYPNFIETVIRLLPMHRLRAVGGGLYICGVLLMAWNLYKTAKAGRFVEEDEVQAPTLEGPRPVPGKRWGHRWLEARPVLFTALTTLAILVGGLVEVVPMYLIKNNVPTIASVTPYTSLEVLGRDIYIREGCVACHSQMVRPLRSETERYGEYSKAGEYVYEHPFLWGSKRSGPDLHRVGGKYPNAWHYRHMEDPGSTSPGSIMPSYRWLLEQKLDVSSLPARLRALRRAGVPYLDGYETMAQEELEAQAQQIVQGLKIGSVDAPADREIIALIAYLQRLGTDVKAAGKP
jgi:cytochrome c oxidase cbb3-type subunit I/II